MAVERGGDHLSVPEGGEEQVVLVGVGVPGGSPRVGRPGLARVLPRSVALRVAQAVSVERLMVEEAKVIPAGEGARNPARGGNAAVRSR
jgi:hypothetical protein